MTALGVLGEDFNESMHHRIRTDIQKRFPKLVFYLESGRQTSLEDRSGQTFRNTFPPDPEKIRQRKRKGGAKGSTCAMTLLIKHPCLVSAHGLKPIEYGDEVFIPYNDPANDPQRRSAISTGVSPTTVPVTRIPKQP